MERIITQEQQSELYRQAFKQVCNPDDWKDEVDCVVPYDMANVYMQAIEFMTGVRPDAEVVVVNYQQMFRLTCCGYRMGPCGDF